MRRFRKLLSSKDLQWLTDGHRGQSKPSRRPTCAWHCVAICLTTTLLNTHLHNPEDASTQWAEVTDPSEPLFGKRFQIERVANTPQEVAHVFLRREDGVVLRVPLRATNLSTLVRHAPRAKLCQEAVQEFLDLVKEYERCVKTPANKSAKSGPRSNKRTRSKS